MMFCNSPADKLLTQYFGVTSKNFQQTNLKKPVFEAVKLTMRDSDYKDLNESKDPNKEFLSLEDIIILQEDEPKQKSYIYSLRNCKPSSSSTLNFYNLRTKEKERYSQIRVKSIVFLGE